MQYPLGPVDLTQTHTHLQVLRGEVRIPWLRNLALVAGEYLVAGDCTQHLAHPRTRRAIAAGCMTVTIVPPATPRAEPEPLVPEVMRPDLGAHLPEDLLPPPADEPSEADVATDPAAEADISDEQPVVIDLPAEEPAANPDECEVTARSLHAEEPSTSEDPTPNTNAPAEVSPKPARARRRRAAAMMAADVTESEPELPSPASSPSAHEEDQAPQE